MTALPAPVLAELARDGVLRRPACRLRRLGTVWPAPDIAEAPPPVDGAAPLLFDLHPLGDLAGVVLRREARYRPQPIPLGPIRIDEDSGDAVFVDTKLATPRDADGFGELLVRGPVVSQSLAGPLAADSDGFVGTGLRAAASARDTHFSFKRDPELLRHGGIAIATSEIDALYRSYPGFLDAACFVLSDPIMGDRIFAAVMPRPAETVSLEALKAFLAERGVAPYKFPDRLLVVKEIPRDADGRVLREEILRQV